MWSPKLMAVLLGIFISQVATTSKNQEPKEPSLRRLIQKRNIPQQPYVGSGPYTDYTPLSSAGPSYNHPAIKIKPSPYIPKRNESYVPVSLISPPPTYVPDLDYYAVYYDTTYEPKVVPSAYHQMYKTGPQQPMYVEPVRKPQYQQLNQPQQPVDVEPVRKPQYQQLNQPQHGKQRPARGSNIQLSPPAPYETKPVVEQTYISPLGSTDSTYTASTGPQPYAPPPLQQQPYKPQGYNSPSAYYSSSSDPYAYPQSPTDYSPPLTYKPAIYDRFTDSAYGAGYDSRDFYGRPGYQARYDTTYEPGYRGRYDMPYRSYRGAYDLYGGSYSSSPSYGSTYSSPYATSYTNKGYESYGTPYGQRAPYRGGYDAYSSSYPRNPLYGLSLYTSSYGMPYRSQTSGSSYDLPYGSYNRKPLASNRAPYQSSGVGYRPGSDVAYKHLLASYAAYDTPYRSQYNVPYSTRDSYSTYKTPLDADYRSGYRQTYTPFESYGTRPYEQKSYTPYSSAYRPRDYYPESSYQDKSYTPAYASRY